MSTEEKKKDYTHKCILFTSPSEYIGSDNNNYAMKGPHMTAYDALVVMADNPEIQIDLRKISYRSVTAEENSIIEKNISDHSHGEFLSDEGSWEITYKSGRKIVVGRNEVLGYGLGSHSLEGEVDYVASKKTAEGN